MGYDGKNIQLTYTNYDAIYNAQMHVTMVVLAPVEKGLLFVHQLRFVPLYPGKNVSSCLNPTKILYISCFMLICAGYIVCEWRVYVWIYITKNILYNNYIIIIYIYNLFCGLFVPCFVYTIVSPPYHLTSSPVLIPPHLIPTSCFLAANFILLRCLLPVIS